MDPGSVRNKSVHHMGAIGVFEGPGSALNESRLPKPSGVICCINIHLVFYRYVDGGFAEYLRRDPIRLPALAKSAVCDDNPAAKRDVKRRKTASSSSGGKKKAVQRA
ncbi:hypothetical protein PInf_023357 [Phytophthora infestans]|nr:hypothetical protein PInf_023357 [Phytophthora infestans]